jgi:hypothetical protein
VHVFVRDPGKLSAAIKERVHTIPGNLTDPVAVADAVMLVSPAAIIICSGHPPNDMIAPLNSIAVPAIVRALTETGRLGDCFVIYLSGLFSDPADDPLPWHIRIVRGILVPLSGFQASLSDNLEVTRYLTEYEVVKSNLQFTIVRMGYPVEGASKGEIIPVNYIPRGSVTFSDMALFLVKLAHGAHRSKVFGKATKVSYAGQ